MSDLENNPAKPRGNGERVPAVSPTGPGSDPRARPAVNVPLEPSSFDSIGNSDSSSMEEEPAVFRASELFNELSEGDLDEEFAAGDPLGSLDDLMSNVEGALGDFAEPPILDSISGHELSGFVGGVSAPDFPSLSFDGIEPNRATSLNDDPFFSPPAGSGGSPSGIFRTHNPDRILQPKAGLESILADVLPQGHESAYSSQKPGGPKSGSSLDGLPIATQKAGTMPGMPMVSSDAYEDGRDALGSSMSLSASSKSQLGHPQPEVPPAPAVPILPGNEVRDGDPLTDILWTATVVDDGEAPDGQFGGDAMEFPEIELDTPGATMVVQGRSEMIEELRAAAAARGDFHAPSAQPTRAESTEDTPITIESNVAMDDSVVVGAGNALDDPHQPPADEANILDGDFKQIPAVHGGGFGDLGESNIMGGEEYQPDSAMAPTPPGGVPNPTSPFAGNAPSPFAGVGSGFDVDEGETYHRGSIELALENYDSTEQQTADEMHALEGIPIDLLGGSVISTEAPQHSGGLPGETVIVSSPGGLFGVPGQVAITVDEQGVLDGPGAFGNPDVLSGGAGSSLFQRSPTLIGRMEPSDDSVRISVNKNEPTLPAGLRNPPAGQPPIGQPPAARAKAPAPETIFDPQTLERGMVEEVRPVWGASDDSNELARLAASLADGDASGPSSSLSRQSWDRPGIGQLGRGPAEPVLGASPAPLPAEPAFREAAPLPWYHPAAYGSGDLFLIGSCVVVFGLMGLLSVELVWNAVSPSEDTGWSLLRWLSSRVLGH